MKKNFFLNAVIIFTIAALFSINSLFAEDAKKQLPAVKVKDLTGKTLNTKDFDNDGKPIVIAFWATWCKPCLEELSAMSELYDEWQKETGVKIIAISIDDSRTSKKVAPLLKSRQWTFEVYLDENSDLKRAMGVSNPPHSFLLDGNKNIVFEHNGFAQGDEENLIDEIKKLTSAK
ncbi:MAG: TlpA family protein disulfide reductase [Ignavibacteria bacterium]|jgi:peroxiredoxin|nr:TlpA family protein disulfide reductase [Ignavibacteria bacterium]